MLGWKIFVHSVRMVLGNFRQALQIGLVPVALWFGGAIVVFVAASILQRLMSSGGPESDLFSSGNTTIFLVLIVLWLGMLITACWIVVEWHRFVLLAEYPKGWIPQFRVDRVLSYVGHGFLLGFAAVILLIPVAIASGIASSMSQSSGVVVLGLGALGVIVCLYRLVVLLPAAAIGQPLTFKQAWDATRGAEGAIFVLLIVSGLIQGAVNLITAPLMGVSIVGALAVFAVTLILYLVNVSILTTMYGVFVEKRELS